MTRGVTTERQGWCCGAAEGQITQHYGTGDWDRPVPWEWDSRMGSSSLMGLGTEVTQPYRI